MRQRDMFKWLLLVQCITQLLLLKCEPSQEREKFNHVTRQCKQMSHRDHTVLTAIILHEGPCIISESFGLKCIQLISQVFPELPFLNDNFQTNYNTRNLDISTSEIQVVYKFSKGHSVN